MTEKSIWITRVVDEGDGRVQSDANGLKLDVLNGVAVSGVLANQSDELMDYWAFWIVTGNEGHEFGHVLVILKSTFRRFIHMCDQCVQLYFLNDSN